MFCKFIQGRRHGGAGWALPTLEKIRVGMVHPGIFSPGLKTCWQEFVIESMVVTNLCAWLFNFVSLEPFCSVIDNALYNLLI